MEATMRGLMPQSLGEAFQLSAYLAKSEVIPKALRGKPESVLTVMLTGYELGLSSMQALNNITIISGHLALMSNLQLALVRNSGLLAYWDEGYVVAATDDPARSERTYGWCDVARHGIVDPETGKLKLFRRVFTVAMAEKVVIDEKQWDDSKHKFVSVGKTSLAEKDTYQSWPERMYPYRARSWVLEAVFGDVLKGLPSKEGLEGGQVVTSSPIHEGQILEDEPDAAALLSLIAMNDPELATSIGAGFEVLQLAPGRRLQKLKEFEGRPDDLSKWLKDEYANRKGKRRAESNGGKAAAAPAPTPVDSPSAPPAAQQAPPLTTALTTQPPPIGTLQDDIFGDPRGTARPRPDVERHGFVRDELIAEAEAHAQEYSDDDESI